jgi:hypothetical protein
MDKDENYLKYLKYKSKFMELDIDGQVHKIRKYMRKQKQNNKEVKKYINFIKKDIILWNKWIDSIHKLEDDENIPQDLLGGPSYYDYLKPPSRPAPLLPMSSWFEIKDADNRYYYFNNKTKEATWFCPVPFYALKNRWFEQIILEENKKIHHDYITPIANIPVDIKPPKLPRKTVTDIIHLPYRHMLYNTLTYDEKTKYKCKISKKFLRRLVYIPSEDCKDVFDFAIEVIKSNNDIRNICSLDEDEAYGITRHDWINWIKQIQDLDFNRKIPQDLVGGPRSSKNHSNLLINSSIKKDDIEIIKYDDYINDTYSKIRAVKYKMLNYGNTIPNEKHDEFISYIDYLLTNPSYLMEPTEGISRNDWIDWLLTIRSQKEGTQSAELKQGPHKRKYTYKGSTPIYIKDLDDLIYEIRQASYHR